MKAKEYKTECLEERLKPFIDKYHKLKDVLFWPDLATIHFQKDVQRWMRNNCDVCYKAWQRTERTSSQTYREILSIMQVWVWETTQTTEKF